MFFSYRLRNVCVIATVSAMSALSRVAFDGLIMSDFEVTEKSLQGKKNPGLKKVNTDTRLIRARSMLIPLPNFNLKPFTLSNNAKSYFLFHDNRAVRS